MDWDCFLGADYFIMFTAFQFLFYGHNGLNNYSVVFIETMGIINNDIYVCANGVQKAGTYISFATETIYVTQNYGGMMPSMPGQGSTLPVSGYNVRANYRVFWDQDCREAGKSFIDLKSINVTITADQLDTNIYSVLYAELKNVYPNTSDELKAAAPVVTPVVPAVDPAVPVVPSV